MTLAASQSPSRRGWADFRVVSFLMVDLASGPGLADQQDPRIGRDVLLKSWGTPLRIGTAVSQGSLPHRVFRVERIEGDWLWVVAPCFHGWVKEDEVVSLERALDFFDSEIRVRPEDFGSYLRRGHLLMKLGEFDKSRTDFDEAIRLAPGYPVCFNDRALYWYERKDYVRALADCNEAIRIDPTYANAYDRRAHVYLARKDLGRALADCEEVIRLGGGVASNYYLRALVRHESRDMDRALTDANAAIRLDPEYAAAFRVRGAIRIRKGEFELGIMDCDAALLLDPRDENARHNLEIARGLQSQSNP